MKYIVLDAWGGGSDSGVSGNGIVEKDYTLLISNYIYNRLREKGINVFLTRKSDVDLSVNGRINMIRNEFGDSDDVIVISNQLNHDDTNGIDVIYALRNTDVLAEQIVNFLSDDGFNINDFYQLRNPNDSSIDYEDIIRETADNETIIIRYGNVNNSSDAYDIKNRWQEMAEAVVKAIVLYTGGEYVDEGYYTVVSGDTLYSIANRFNTSVAILKQINNLSSSNLTIGQLLKIPSVGESEEGSGSGSGEKYFLYTVVAGDSLYTIANKYGVTVDGLKSLNNLTSNTLNIGQVLKIPESSSNGGVNYIVVSGDSLYSIARKYNTTVDEIKLLNNLTSNSLSIGQILKIPSDDGSSGNGGNGGINYVVVSGDSLYSIARKYNTTVDEIKSLNNLINNNLSIGQVLKIPSITGGSSNNYINYIVISGDSLYAIARKYNTTVDLIKSLNNLTSNTLSIGQTLKIPR